MMVHRQLVDPPVSVHGERSSREEASHDSLDKGLSSHLLTILSVSAGMVGVCLTAISLIGITRSLTQLETICDDILATNSLVYLVASGLSFAGLRTPLRAKARQVALAVDAMFCLGLGLTVAACVMLVWFVV